MRRWDELKPDLDELGVDFVAISAETPAEVSKYVAKSKTELRLLSDEHLEITDVFNLRSQKTLAFSPGRGLRRFLAIPTTILVDADGIVRWIDQAQDYRIRNDPQRALDVARETLPEDAAA